MSGINLTKIPIKNKVAASKSSIFNFPFMPKYPIKKDMAPAIKKIVVTIGNKRSLSASRFFLISDNEYVFLCLSESNPNFFNTKKSIIVGISRNKTGILGKNFFPRRSGNASITNSTKKRRIIDIKKFLAYRFARVCDSIFFHQRMSNIRVTRENIV
ncbi:MAG: hypothetical protein WBH77_00065 [Saccharofermentanales bacterium]